MEQRKIVLHYADGTVGAGFSEGFPDGVGTFRIETLEGRVLEVDLATLKAAFFVKTFSGNRDYERPEDTDELRERTQGRFVRVSFKDGEILVGEVSREADLARGFFLKVLDPNDNNVMVYVNPGYLSVPPED